MNLDVRRSSCIYLSRLDKSMNMRCRSPSVGMRTEIVVPVPGEDSMVEPRAELPGPCPHAEHAVTIGRGVDGAGVEAPPVVTQLRVELMSRQPIVERRVAGRRVPRDVGDSLLEQQEEMASRLRIEPDVREIGWRRV